MAADRYLELWNCGLGGVQMLYPFGSSAKHPSVHRSCDLWSSMDWDGIVNQGVYMGHVTELYNHLPMRLNLESQNRG
jgi:hypothetical protein